MKKYIRNNNALISKLPILEEISINMNADITKYIQSADLIGKGILEDTQVLADWVSFIDTVRIYIDLHDSLELLYQKPGDPLDEDPDIPGSYYYYIGVRDAEGKFSGQIVVDFRLATHSSTKTSAKYREKYEAEALQIIRKEYLNANQVIPKGIVVNKKEFADYDIAKLAIVGMMDSIIEKYG